MATTQNKLEMAIGLLQDWEGDVKAYAETHPHPELTRILSLLGHTIPIVRRVQEDVEIFKKSRE